MRIRVRIAMISITVTNENKVGRSVWITWDVISAGVPSANNVLRTENTIASTVKVITLFFSIKLIELIRI